MRGEPEVLVTCDNCGDEILVGLTTTARGYDERHMDDEIEGFGWKVVDGKDYCPICAKELFPEDEE